MPTINEYTGGTGFYIRARPSDAGNITYQVTEIANEIFRNIGYEDGDDVGWQTIQALMVADLVYTGNQGIDESSEADILNEVDSSTENITEREAELILNELQEQASLSDSQKDEVEDVLGVTFESNFERVETSIRQTILQAGQRGDLDPLALSEHEFIVEVSGIGDSSENGLCNISLTGTLDGTFDEEPYQHGIFVCEEHGLEGWRCRSDFADSWEFKAEMYRQMGVLLPIIIEVLESDGIDVGTPEETPPPEIGSWGFE